MRKTLSGADFEFFTFSSGAARTCSENWPGHRHTLYGGVLWAYSGVLCTVEICTVFPMPTLPYFNTVHIPTIHGKSDRTLNGASFSVYSSVNMYRQIG